MEARNKWSARPVRRVERDPGAEWDADAWWARIPAVRAVLDAGLELPTGVTFLVGENGSGKSTLIEALAQAYGLNPEGGSRGAMHRTRHTESPLGEVLRLVRTPGRRGDAYFMRAETTHGLYTYLEGLADSPDRDLHDRSHGEGFLALLDRKFARPGFSLLDEPEVALSFTPPQPYGPPSGTGRSRGADRGGHSLAGADRAAGGDSAGAWRARDPNHGVV